MTLDIFGPLALVAADQRDCAHACCEFESRGEHYHDFEPDACPECWDAICNGCGLATHPDDRRYDDRGRMFCHNCI